MRLSAALLVTALCGAIALSYEILWVRVYGFMTEGEPEAFGALLCAYLGGLALGALFARRFCERHRRRGGPEPLALVGWLLLAANLLGFLAIPAAAHLVSAWACPPPQSLALFALVAALLGTSFPLLAHLGVPADERAGARLSYLYVANILGSSAGSLLTGFVLLDRLSLQEVSTLLAAAGIAASALLILSRPRTIPPRERALLLSGPITALALVVAGAPNLYTSLYEKLLYKSDYDPSERFTHVYENRGGVVTVTAAGVLYGNGSYDGHFNIDPHPERDSNRVLRAYMIPAFHPAPKEVLMIGLGSGSWLQVLAHHPAVERITVVEINPGYVEAMRDAPLVASALTMPHVEVLIDDGRRYLSRTPRRFDVIVQNTIVYWRGHATNLLSTESMELSKRRLQPEGRIFYNSTASTAAQRTGALVFPHARRFQNMIIAGMTPITIDEERWLGLMEAWTIDGRKVFPDVRDYPSPLAQRPWRGVPTWEERDALLDRTRDAPRITDDNMASEWWAFDTYP